MSLESPALAGGYLTLGFPGGSVFTIFFTNTPANAGDSGDLGLMPGSGRSPGGGNGNPLQYSCLEIPWLVGYRPCDAKSRTGLSTLPHFCHSSPTLPLPHIHSSYAVATDCPNYVVMCSCFPYLCYPLEYSCSCPFLILSKTELNF